jgi:hypothetical protein
MKHARACLAVASVLIIAPAGAAFAGSGPVGGLFDSLVAQVSSLFGVTTSTTVTTDLGPTLTGQPGASCEDNPNQPGNSITATGSAFNPTGVSGGVYAGEQTNNTINIATSSQYDVACLYNQSNK